MIAVFYLLYRLLLHRSTLHRLNRMVLLGSLVLSLALPLCVITIHKTIDVSAENTSMGSSAVVNAIAEMRTAAIERPVAPVAKADVPEADEADAYYPLGNDMAAEYVVMDDVAAQAPVATDNATSNRVTIPWLTVFSVIFLCGVAFMLLRFIWSVVCVRLIIRGSRQVAVQDGCRILVTERKISAFSFGYSIVIPRSEWDGEHDAMLCHEKAHARLHHSIDNIAVELVKSFQWFNPAIWFLASDLREVHEYEADDAVIQGGVDANEYQHLLIGKAMLDTGYSVANGFNRSSLSSRIAMMSQPKTPAGRGARALYIIPVICMALLAGSKTVYAATDVNDVKTDDAGTADNTRQVNGSAHAQYGGNAWVPHNTWEGWNKKEVDQYVVWNWSAAELGRFDGKKKDPAQASDGNDADLVAAPYVFFIPGGYTGSQGISGNGDGSNGLLSKEEYNRLLAQTYMLSPESDRTAAQIEMQIKVQDYFLEHLGFDGKKFVLPVSREQFATSGIPDPYYDVLQYQVYENTSAIAQWQEEGLINDSIVESFGKSMDEAKERYWKTERPQLVERLKSMEQPAPAADVVTGIVTDKYGPMMLVNIYERDSENRIISIATTDMEGRFSLRLQDPEDRIEASYTGYLTKSVPIDSHYLEIKMEEDDIPDYPYPVDGYPVPLNRNKSMEQQDTAAGIAGVKPQNASLSAAARRNTRRIKSPAVLDLPRGRNGNTEPDDNGHDEAYFASLNGKAEPVPEESYLPGIATLYGHSYGLFSSGNPRNVNVGLESMVINLSPENCMADIDCKYRITGADNPQKLKFGLSYWPEIVEYFTDESIEYIQDEAMDNLKVSLDGSIVSDNENVRLETRTPQDKSSFLSWVCTPGGKDDGAMGVQWSTPFGKVESGNYGNQTEFFVSFTIPDNTNWNAISNKASVEMHWDEFSDMQIVEAYPGGYVLDKAAKCIIWNVKDLDKVKRRTVRLVFHSSDSHPKSILDNFEFPGLNKFDSEPVTPSKLPEPTGAEQRIR